MKQESPVQDEERVITDEMLALARSRIGVPMKVHVPFNEFVTVDAIRHFAHGTGDDNPLYCDRNYGAKTRWGSTIAPPPLLQKHWQPRATRLEQGRQCQGPRPSQRHPLLVRGRDHPLAPAHLSRRPAIRPPISTGLPRKAKLLHWRQSSHRDSSTGIQKPARRIGGSGRRERVPRRPAKEVG